MCIFMERLVYCDYCWRSRPHIEFFIPQFLQVLLLRDAFNPFITESVLTQWIALLLALLNFMRFTWTHFWMPFLSSGETTAPLNSVMCELPNGILLAKKIMYEVVSLLFYWEKEYWKVAYYFFNLHIFPNLLNNF